MPYKASVTIGLKKDDLIPSNILKLRDRIYKLNKKGYKVDVIITQDLKKQKNSSRVNYIYTDEELSYLQELETFLKSTHNGTLTFNEYKGKNIKTEYTLSDVYHTNNVIKNIANKIKKTGYSEFETVLFIHQYITQRFSYDKNPKKLFTDDGYKGRVLVDTFKNKKICCAGFSSLFKAIVDEVNMPNLKADFLATMILEKRKNKRRLVNHSQCLVDIKDDKYDIDGIYVEDVTFDSLNKEDATTIVDSKNNSYVKNNNLGFANCLVPIEAYLNFKDEKFFFRKFDNRFNTLLASRRNILKARVENYFFVRKYKDKSNPIPIKTFYEGLGNVFFNAIKQEKYDISRNIHETISKIQEEFKPYRKNENNIIIEDKDKLSISVIVTESLNKDTPKSPHIRK